MAEVAPIKLTVFAARSGVLTKTLTPGADGKLDKTVPLASFGHTTTVTIPFNELPDLIASLGTSQCLIHGISEYDSVEIVPMAASRDGAISRTKEYFQYTDGPGLGMLDHDPDGVGQYFSPAELLEAAASVFPQFRETGHLIRYSTSSHVYNAEGARLSSSDPGYHYYFAARDAKDLPRFGEVLFKRTWLAGYGHCRLSRSGAVLVRGPLDKTVFSPERCDFVAGAVLGGGLTQNFPASQFTDGQLLDTHALPDLTVDEERQYQALVAAEYAKLKPEQETTRREYAETESVRTGKTPETIYRRLTEAQSGHISADEVLKVKDFGHGMSIRDMVSLHLDGAYIEDPTEETDTWARLHIDDYGNAVVHSFLHGGTRLAVDYGKEPDDNGGFPISLPKLEQTEKIQDGVPFSDALGGFQKYDTADNFARHALAIVNKFSFRVPVQASADELMDDIRRNCTDIPDGYTALLRGRLDWMLGLAKKEAVKLTAFSPETTARHNLRRITKDQLNNIRDFSGVIICKAPHDSGKTQQLGVPFSEASQKSGLNFTAICHRQTLATELATRLSCRHYQDIDSEILPYVSAIATCVNSLPRFIRKGGGGGGPQTAIYIDEFSQVRRHIATGSIPDSLRAEVLNSFITVIKNASCLVLTDADLSDEDILFLEQCRPGERFQVYEVVGDHGHLAVTYEYGKDACDKALVEILAGLADGQNVIVATDSQKKVERLIKLVGEELPDISTLGITANNKGGDRQHAFIEDPSGECIKYSLIVHSPCISSGISINEDHFDAGYGLFCGTIAPSDMLQMIRRPRKLCAWHITFDAASGNLNRGMLDNAGMRIEGRRQAHTDGQENPQVTLTKLETLKENVLAWENRSKADCARNLIFTLEHLGYVVKKIELPVTAGNEVGRIKEIVNELKITAILNAADINDGIAEKYRKAIRISEAQVHELERHKLKSTLSLEIVTRDDVVFWDDGFCMPRLRRYELAAGYRTGDDDGAATGAEKQFGTLKAKMMQALVEILGLDIVAGTGSFTVVEANQAIDLISQSAVLHSYLGIAPASIARKRPTRRGATRVILNVLYRMGLKIHSKQVRVDGEQVGQISLNLERIGQLRLYAERRSDTEFGVGQGGSNCQRKAISLIDKTPYDGQMAPLDGKVNKQETVLDRHGILPLNPILMSVIAPDLFPTESAAKSYRKRHPTPEGPNLAPIRYRQKGQSGSPSKAIVDTARLPTGEDVAAAMLKLVEVEISDITGMPDQGERGNVVALDIPFEPISQTPPPVAPKPLALVVTVPIDGHVIETPEETYRRIVEGMDPLDWLDFDAASLEATRLWDEERQAIREAENNRGLPPWRRTYARARIMELKQ